jgi:hypothetical protein
MPITPFHVIAAAPIKAIFPRHFSWSIFTLTNIFIDIEPITYFIFTVVRNPFDRFKSTFIEEILYNKYKFKTISMGSSLTANNRSLVDPWVITGHEHLSTQQKNSVELQAELLINKLRILRDKGGFERLGVCETPIHLWPQHYFTSLTTPEPLNYRILKYIIFLIFSRSRIKN